MIYFLSVQPHLLFNHFPVIGCFIGICLWLYAYIKRTKDVLLLSYIFSAVVGASGIIAAMTGEQAENKVKEYNQAEMNGKPLESPDKEKIVFSPQSLEWMEKHQESGIFFRNLMVLLLIASSIGIIAPRYRTPMLMYVCMTILGASLYFAFDAAHTGGMIRHPEIR
ncbi:MAG: hypothetical protein NZ455_09010 [Bacteroidia bacterium]|nr:hypothetical protein [Bacteroidia bacterium]MDW8346304.1 hypothetical protein [Bacteroidia bacterium]